MRKLFFAAVLLLLPSVIFASSFSLSEQSVSGLGVAFAGGAAQAEDASTLFFNPAGIVLLDQGELQLAGNVIIPSARFTNQGSRYNLPGTPFNGLPLAGSNDGDAGVTHVVPNFYFTQPIFRHATFGDLTIGLGLSVPFGLETDYSPDWVGRYHALRTKLTVLDIQPAVAYRLFDRFSVGATIDIERASARLTQGIDFGLVAQQPLATFFTALPAILAARGVPAAAIPGIINATRAAYASAGFVPGGRDAVLELHGDGWNVGFTLGAIFEYHKAGENDPLWQDGRIGFSYRSGVDHTVEGPADFRRVPLIVAPGAPVQFPQPTAFQDVFFKQSGHATIDLPEIFRWSIYQRLLQQFAVLGDLTWTRWGRLQSVPIIFENPGTPASSLNINYQDALRYAVGLEWYAAPNLTLRTGFAYDETPIRSENFRSPRIPDNNRYFLSAGLRWSPTSFMDIDVGYAHLFVPDSSTDLLDTQGHELRGTFETSVDIVSAALTFRWGGVRPPIQTNVSTKDVAGYRK